MLTSGCVCVCVVEGGSRWGGDKCKGSAGVLNKRHGERVGVGSSVAGPCSVVSTSKAVACLHTDLRSHTQTQLGTLVKAVVAGEAAVRSEGGESRSVGAHGSESFHFLVLLASVSSTLSSHRPLTQMTSDWLAPALRNNNLQNARSAFVCIRDTYGVCFVFFLSFYLLPIALTGSTKMFEPEQSVHPVSCLVLVGVT